MATSALSEDAAGSPSNRLLGGESDAASPLARAAGSIGHSLTTKEKRSNLMPKPACVACKRFYRLLKDGVRVNEQAPQVDWAKPGTQHEEAWKPYKIWNADAWQCHGCGHIIVVGYGQQPEAIQHEPHFANSLAFVDYTINDC